jgi:hypothetical protein
MPPSYGEKRPLPLRRRRNVISLLGILRRPFVILFLPSSVWRRDKLSLYYIQGGCFLSAEKRKMSSSI